MGNSCGLGSMIGLLFLAVAVVACVLLSAALVLAILERERLQKRRKADALRAQWLGTLSIIRESLAPRSRPLEPVQKELYEPIHYLWMQADLLEPEELLPVSHCTASLLALRQKPSLNQTQVRLAQTLIEHTCSQLTRTVERNERRRVGEGTGRRIWRVLTETFGTQDPTASAVHSPGPISQSGLRQ